MARNEVDPLATSRAAMQQVHETGILSSDVLHGTLKDLFGAKIGKLDPRQKHPTDFTLPGSHGDITVSNFSNPPEGGANDPVSYELSFTRPDGLDSTLTTTKNWKEPGEPVRVFQLTESEPHRLDDAETRQVGLALEVVTALALDLVTAMNSIHKPAKGGVAGDYFSEDVLEPAPDYPRRNDHLVKSQIN